MRPGPIISVGGGGRSLSVMTVTGCFGGNSASDFTSTKFSAPFDRSVCLMTCAPVGPLEGNVAHALTEVVSAAKIKNLDRIWETTLCLGGRKSDWAYTTRLGVATMAWSYRRGCRIHTATRTDHVVLASLSWRHMAAQSKPAFPHTCGHIRSIACRIDPS